MPPKLQTQLLHGWQETENPGGPLTFIRGSGPDPDCLQVSVARPRSGTGQTISEQQLVAMCEKLTRDVRGRIQVSSSSGVCEFGIFGSVTVKGESPEYMQAWVVSNRLDFILTTHICYRQPDAQEIAQANRIALTVSTSSA
jgi:hypothetical protein